MIDELPPKTRAFFDRLVLPTHPDFDLLQDSGAVDYTPPATLANYIILYTNAAIELQAQMVVRRKRIEAERLAMKEAERQLRRLKRQLLGSKVPGSATKNLQLTEAFIAERAEAGGRADELAQLETQVEDHQFAIESLKDEVEQLDSTMHTLKLASQNIMTHLSYIKAEQQLGDRR